jgi:hypothetical protein
MEESIGDENTAAELPAPIGWPCSDDENDDSNGLPKLSIMMQVAINLKPHAPVSWWKES